MWLVDCLNWSILIEKLVILFCRQQKWNCDNQRILNKRITKKKLIKRIKIPVCSSVFLAEIPKECKRGLWVELTVESEYLRIFCWTWKNRKINFACKLKVLKELNLTQNNSVELKNLNLWHLASKYESFAHNLKLIDYSTKNSWKKFATQFSAWISISKKKTFTKSTIRIQHKNAMLFTIWFNIYNRIGTFKYAIPIHIHERLECDLNI